LIIISGWFWTLTVIAVKYFLCNYSIFKKYYLFLHFYECKRPKYLPLHCNFSFKSYPEVCALTLLSKWSEAFSTSNTPYFGTHFWVEVIEVQLTRLHVLNEFSPAVKTSNSVPEIWNPILRRYWLDSMLRRLINVV